MHSSVSLVFLNYFSFNSELRIGHSSHHNDMSRIKLTSLFQRLSDGIYTYRYSVIKMRAGKARKQNTF